MATTEEYDFIIIGAGSAGCVVAYRLVQETTATVLLLEAGGRDSRPEIHNEDLGSTLSLWSAADLDWGYVTDPQAGLCDRRIPVARGKVWGGSSSINAMVYVRGNRLDYELWSELGNQGWSFEQVLPYFKKAEDFIGGDSEYRGVGGPLSVVYHHDPTPVSQMLFPAAAELEFEDRGPEFDYNASDQEGIPFYYQATKTRKHTRASTAVAYLYPILDKPNFRIESEAQVTRILMRGTRAVGVEYLKDGQLVEVRGRNEIVLCGGAYESPKLLMLSGIGPAETLKTHGVPIVTDLPGVGQNLQDHLILSVCFLSKYDHPSPPTLIAETGLFVHTRDGVTGESPDLQVKFGGLKFVNPSYDREGPGFTFAPVLIQPESIGYVTLRSNNPLDVGVLQPNYLSTDADMQVFLYGIELARAFTHTAALSEFVKEEIAPGVDISRTSDLQDYVRSNAGTLWHPVGTCKMGGDEMAVVDAQLRLHGIDGLRVADASVMPRIVAGNPNAACIMIGERISDDLKLANR